MAKKSFTIADTIAQIESITTRLEDNDISLEQSLQDFEQGVQLIRQAQQALQEAEQKVKLLVEKSGEPLSAPFDEAGEEEDTE